MASLIAPLACGFVGASSGSAEIFRQGTSTLAQVYSDPEGETQVTSHALDANGGVTRYVEERVDVVVYDSGGATVRTFTWGTDARDSRLENLGFTGPDAQGVIKAGGRTTVDAAFTKLFESLGATDGNVDVSGTAMSLSDAASSSAGVLYNVKSYGAVGNGTANDTPSIQAAMNAAAAAGGGIIFFPHGTYKLSSVVTADASAGKFTYLGESSSATSLVKSDAGNLVEFGDANSVIVQGIKFTGTPAETGAVCVVGAGGRAAFVGCEFTASNGPFVDMGDATASAVLIGCKLAQNGADSRIGGFAGTVRLVGCDITVGATSGGDYTSFDEDMTVALEACTITMGTAISAGTSTLFPEDSAGFVTGCKIAVAYTSGTVNLATLADLSITGTTVTSAGATVAFVAGSASKGKLGEAGCIFAAPVTVGSPLVTAATSASRNAKSITTLGSFTSYTPNPAYAYHYVETNGASMTFANESPTLPEGWPLVLIWKNGTGGLATPSFGTNYSTAIGSIANIDNAKCGFYVFMKPKSGSDQVLIAQSANGGLTW